MPLSKPQEFILFLLGKCYDHVSHKISDPLEVGMRKCDFIALAKAAGLVDKSDRAMYKNLELLQKTRHIDYRNNLLSLTKKGRNHYSRTSNKVDPYINLAVALSSKDVLKFAKRNQLRFRN
ncbi:hypothetical protein KY329_02460 [Candidatus Woesearchaeota archaeon]|nr:hypothetical protein [Candidatus Woesearchaeota archaeon]